MIVQESRVLFWSKRSLLPSVGSATRRMQRHRLPEKHSTLPFSAANRRPGLTLVRLHISPPSHQHGAIPCHPMLLQVQSYFFRPRTFPVPRSGIVLMRFAGPKWRCHVYGVHCVRDMCAPTTCMFSVSSLDCFSPPRGWAAWKHSRTRAEADPSSYCSSCLVSLSGFPGIPVAKKAAKISLSTDCALPCNSVRWLGGRDRIGAMSRSWPDLATSYTTRDLPYED